MSIGSDRAKARLTKCECGEPLPMHMVDLYTERDTYVCSCEQAYKATCGMWIHIGTQENAIARLDEKVKGAKCKKCDGDIDYITVSLFHQITGKTDKFPSYCMDCMGEALMKLEPRTRGTGDTR